MSCQCPNTPGIVGGICPTCHERVAVKFVRADGPSSPPRGADRERAIHNATHRIWRNKPLYPSTFGPCFQQGCSEMARGGGLCLDCSTRQLGDLVGADEAKRYRELVEEARELEGKWIFGTISKEKEASR